MSNDSSRAHHNPHRLFLLGLIVFAVYKLFFERQRERSEPVQSPLFARKLHPYALGCALALTHIIVPTFLPGYAYLAALLINTKLIPDTNAHYLLMSLAFGVGNFLWVLGLVGYFRNANPAEEKARFRRIDIVIGTLFLIIGVSGAARLIYEGFAG